MKKTISALLVCMLLVGCIFTLASCGQTLSGSYTADLSVLGVYTYEFNMFGKVTRTIDPFVGNDVDVAEGEYKISEDGSKITLTFDGEAQTYELKTGEEGGVKYIKLDGVQYNKK